MPYLLTLTLCLTACPMERRVEPSRGACIRAELQIKRDGGWARCHMIKLPMAEGE